MSMNRVDQTELLLRAVTRKLTPEEQARFDQLIASDPAFREAWEEEKTLEQSLAALPDAPISSNFTSIVLQAAQRQENTRTAAPARFFRWPRLSWTTRLAGMAAACLALVLGIHQYQTHQRTEVAESLSAISDVTTVLTPEQDDATQAAALLQDFDAIASLSNMPAEPELDLELLVALQR